MTHHRMKMDHILVVDVESTCWADEERDRESEIIEIGWCMLNTHRLEREERGDIIVHPAFSTVSDFCTQLTTLTQAHVDQGIPFAEACRKLRALGSKNVTWTSYGDYDRKMFERQTWHAKSKWQAEYPFGPRHLNVKNLCALMMGWEREVGMDEALKRLGLPLEGTHHRGGDDAYNIAAILALLLKQARPGREP